MSSRIHFSPVSGLTLPIAICRYVLYIKVRAHSLRLINRVKSGKVSPANPLICMSELD
jgi:hypothetical protein